MLLYLTYLKKNIENWSQLRLNFNAEILRINDIETCFKSVIIEVVKNKYNRNYYSSKLIYNVS